MSEGDHLDQIIRHDSDDDIEEFTEEEMAKDPHKRLLWAAENNILNVATNILSSDSTTVEATDDDQYTPLHRASYNDHPQMVKLLLEHGANLEAKTKDGWQPLHSAARWNSTSVGQILLGQGADINAQTHGGLTPLHLAASESNNGDMLQMLLISPCVDVNIRSKTGETARTLCERLSPHSRLFDICDDSINRLKPL